MVVHACKGTQWKHDWTKQRGNETRFSVQVPTLEEYIAVARGAPRVVGIYPETKHPSWHNSLPLLRGTSMEDLLLRVLADGGYRGGLQSHTWAAQPCFIQSFEARPAPRTCSPISPQKPPILGF